LFIGFQNPKSFSGWGMVRQRNRKEERQMCNVSKRGIVKNILNFESVGRNLVGWKKQFPSKFYLAPN